MKEKNNLMKKIYTFFLYPISLLLFLLVFITQITNSNVFENSSLIIFNILSIIILFGIIYIFNKFILKEDRIINGKLKKGNAKKFIYLNICIYILLVIISGTIFKTGGNTDVIELRKLSFTESISDGISWYFYTFPYQVFPAMLLRLSHKFFWGLNNSDIILASILLILTNIYSIKLTKEIYGEKAAFFTSLIFIFLIPLYLYVTPVYTDVLSVLFPILILYNYIKILKYNKLNNKIAFILSILVGGLMKATVLIVVIAIAIEVIMTSKNASKKILPLICIGVLSFFIVSKTIYKRYHLGKTEGEYSVSIFPKLHWINMGLTKTDIKEKNLNYGGYSDEIADYLFTLNTYEKKNEYSKNGVLSKIKSRNLNEHLDFYFNKFKYNWNDGSFYVFIMRRDNTFKSLDKNLNLYLDILWSFIVLNTIINIILNIKKYRKMKNGKDKINQNKEMFLSANRIMYLSIIGICLFLLLWEAKSRYVFNYLPIIVILSSFGINNTIKFLNNVKLKNREI